MVLLPPPISDSLQALFDHLLHSPCLSFTPQHQSQTGWIGFIAKIVRDIDAQCGTSFEVHEAAKYSFDEGIIGQRPERPKHHRRHLSPYIPPLVVGDGG